MGAAGLSLVKVIFVECSVSNIDIGGLLVNIKHRSE